MTSTTLTFPTPASLGSLDHYIQAVNRFPLLTAEQETELGRRLQRDRTTSTPRRQLVLSHLRLVVAVSRNYLGYGLPQADLIQEGNVGLMKAVRRFDPERGVRLVSFALHWIRAEMHEYILRNWRLVKVATTKAQRKLFFNLRSMKAQLGRAVGRRSEGDREGPRRQARGGRRDGNAPLRARHRARPARRTTRRTRVADRLPHRQRRRAGADPRARSRRRRTARKGLQHGARQARRPQPPHHRGALAARGRFDATLQELADEYGVSAERIRQIESKAMKTMRGADGGSRRERSQRRRERTRNAGLAPAFFARALVAAAGRRSPPRARPACRARRRDWSGSGRSRTP